MYFRYRAWEVFMILFRGAVRSILGTYWHYMFYGDEQIIRDNYEAGKRYLAHEAFLRDEEGFINHGLGDWGNPEHAPAAGEC